jgi:hypothetical protein
VIVSAWDRLIEALEDPDWEPTPDQVAFLMATAARWARESVEGEPSPETYRAGFDDGYRARVAEENAAGPPTEFKVYISDVRQMIDRVDYRRECDRVAMVSRTGDYWPGDPVEPWGDDGDGTPEPW